MDWDKVLGKLAENWDVIFGSLPLFLFFLGVVAWLTYMLVRDKYKTQIANAESKAQAAQSLRELAEAKTQELREETEHMAAQIAEYRKVSALTPAERVGFGSPALQQSVKEVITREYIFSAPVTELSGQELMKYAMFARAQELGAARITERTPTHTTVAGTISVADFASAIGWIKKKEKK